MPRRTWRRGKNDGVRTNPPTEAALFVAVILWLIGFASTILGVIALPGTWGVWSLALSGLLLIFASVLYGL